MCGGEGKKIIKSAMTTQTNHSREKDLIKILFQNHLGILFATRQPSKKLLPRKLRKNKQSFKTKRLRGLMNNFSSFPFFFFYIMKNYNFEKAIFV